MNADGLRNYVAARAPVLNLDPDAVLAVASVEGIGGGIGDNGTSFGPWQLHIGGALPSYIAEQAPDWANAWAWSTTGVDYALDRIAAVAAGLSGLAAIDAIVRLFERPRDPDAEVEKATAVYYGTEHVGGVALILPGGTTVSRGALVLVGVLAGAIMLIASRR